MKRGHKRVDRPPEQAKERQAEQVRRYSRATGRALKILKDLHQDEYWAIFDAELPKVYEESGPLPYDGEEEECQQTTA